MIRLSNRRSVFGSLTILQIYVIYMYSAIPERSYQSDQYGRALVLCIYNLQKESRA
jgi:hypothetical protein